MFGSSEGPVDCTGEHDMVEAEQAISQGRLSHSEGRLVGTNKFPVQLEVVPLGPA